MTFLMSLSAVSPGNASTLNIDLCSRFLSYGRWINVEQDWVPIIQNTINRKSIHLAMDCDSCHSSNRHMHTSTSITCEATQYVAACSDEILLFRRANRPI